MFIRLISEGGSSELPRQHYLQTKRHIYEGLTTKSTDRVIDPNKDKNSNVSHNTGLFPIHIVHRPGTEEGTDNNQQRYKLIIGKFMCQNYPEWCINL